MNFVPDVDPENNRKGMRSGNRGGHVIGPPRPTHMLGNVASRKDVTLQR